MSLRGAKRALTDVVVTLLRDDPEGWTGGEFTLDHTSGLRLWVGSGFFFLGVHHPAEAKFGGVGKIRVWWAIGRLLARRKRQFPLPTETQTQLDNMQKIRQLLKRWSGDAA